ncbi:hypothetical protein T4A_1432 [Trichinella pseudospiralis]|uniref:Uncharacterized protein n=1 Tax=Trichinella pseudospiralis TaxID=6337 RepID=A0A0V1DPJ5_TRIPS|nr:hypothetical protein T4A_1432 [Trichinella pseudospiralis]
MPLPFPSLHSLCPVFYPTNGQQFCPLSAVLIPFQYTWFSIQSSPWFLIYAAVICPSI